MKKPKDSPTSEGQRVLLRGRGAIGTVEKIDEDGWVWVRWHDPKDKAPKVCFVTELALL